MRKACVKEMQDILADDLKKGLPADLVEAAKQVEADKGGAEEEFRPRPCHGLVRRADPRREGVARGHGAGHREGIRGGRKPGGK